MRNKIIVIAFLSFLVQSKLLGQVVKVGYADQHFIYNNLPEYKAFTKNIEVNAAQYQNIIKEKYALYQQKLAAYQKDYKAQVASVVLKDKESELENLQKSIQDFQVNSESDLKSLYQKNFSPIREKVQKAITDYAKDNHYTYILRLQFEDSIGESRSVILYANDPGGDISKEILLKLGVSLPAKQK